MNIEHKHNYERLSCGCCGQCECGEWTSHLHTQPTPTQDWEHKLEEHFVHFHFAHDNNVEQDKDTLEFREFIRDFITSLLAKEREKAENGILELCAWQKYPEILALAKKRGIEMHPIVELKEE